MTDPQSAEGEYSVSSVGFEFISRVMEEKRVISVILRYHNPEDCQDSWAIIPFTAPSRSSIWGLNTVLGHNQKTRTSPSALGSSPFFRVLDHPQWIQEIWAKIILIFSLGPPGTLERLGPGELQ
ncbi:hypothetical protein O181_132020 [Austropuccinia psidii MF-1]|uniref:Uncharacterized protein n=1 Tax=Austropuccinia psidii MF-1 TaxID=1389203 RepID=A0A9Q3L227_9BASI|nr:hypothetical protein [Austropuccinia psidii MF-1]